MALEATHIRFALDLKDKYQVKDLEKYVSGTIYPDSRYVSEIGRELTHPKDHMDWDIFKVDDFKKGWLVHLLCDKIQYLVTKEKFPEIFEGQDASAGNERWIGHTALKILQDIDDVQKFDITKYLPYLDYVANPNGEDIAKVKQYNQIFQRVYKDPGKVPIEDYYEMWKELGIGDELATKVRNKTEKFQKDPKTMELIRPIYSEMLSRVQ